MPSKLQHELNKLRGKTAADGKIYTASIAVLQDALIDAEIAIKALESEKIDHSTKINYALTKASQALATANQAIPKSDVSLDLQSIVALNTLGLRIWSKNLSSTCYLSNNSGYSSFSKIKSNIIDELTTNSGVTIDTILLKDGKVDGLDCSGIEAGADVTANNTPKAHGAASHTNRTRKIFLTADHTTGSYSSQGTLHDPDADEYSTYLCKLPEDFVSISGLKIILARTAAVAGVVRLDITLYAGGNGEGYSQHTNTQTGLDRALSDSFLHAVALNNTLFNNITKNDYIYIKVNRDANHANDTLAVDLLIRGIEIEYTGDM